MDYNILVSKLIYNKEYMLKYLKKNNKDLNILNDCLSTSESKYLKLSYICLKKYFNSKFINLFIFSNYNLIFLNKYNKLLNNLIFINNFNEQNLVYYETLREVEYVRNNKEDYKNPVYYIIDKIISESNNSNKKLNTVLKQYIHKFEKK